MSVHCSIIRLNMQCLRLADYFIITMNNNLLKLSYKRHVKRDATKLKRHSLSNSLFLDRLFPVFVLIAKPNSQGISYEIALSLSVIFLTKNYLNRKKLISVLIYFVNVIANKTKLNNKDV